MIDANKLIHTTNTIILKILYYINIFFGNFRPFVCLHIFRNFGSMFAFFCANCGPVTHLVTETGRREILTCPGAIAGLPRGYPSLFYEQLTLIANMHKVWVSVTFTNKGRPRFFPVFWPQRLSDWSQCADVLAPCIAIIWAGDPIFQYDGFMLVIQYDEYTLVMRYALCVMWYYGFVLVLSISWVRTSDVICDMQYAILCNAMWCNMQCDTI